MLEPMTPSIAAGLVRARETRWKPSARLLTGPLLALALLLAPVRPATADPLRNDVEAIVKEYLASHPEEVQRVVRSYLLENPSILQEMLAALTKKTTPAAAPVPAPPRQAAPQRAAVAPEMVNSTHQMILGDRQGTTTLVEFFDYNCGFCKRALTDMVDLMRDNPRLKVVLKELPILGPGSLEAARVAVAVRMQDEDGGKSLDFHRKLLGARGQANKEIALAAARDSGLDMVRLEQDMASDEVTVTLNESRQLARGLGINGTPAYLIGDTVVSGAVGYAALRSKLQETGP